MMQDRGKYCVSVKDSDALILITEWKDSSQSLKL